MSRDGRRRNAWATVASLAIMLFLGGLLVPSGVKAAPTNIWLPACTTPGQPINFDLSTTSTAVIDPYWTATAVNTTSPPLPAYRLATSQIPVGWNAALPNWIQPASQPLPDMAAAAGDYVYQVVFNVPKCAADNLTLSGTYWADNSVPIATLIDVNGTHPLATCNQGGLGNCFSAGHQTAFSFSNLQAGTNILTFVVTNGGGPTGLAVSAAVTGHCGARTCPAGLLKVCKVGADGVPSGLPFGFSAGSAMLVPAGAPPDGNCVTGAGLAVGTHVTVTEQVPAGYAVTTINVTPPAQQYGPPNPAAGTAVVTIGPSLTEVTFVDRKNSGWLILCKAGEVHGDFTFMVNPGAVYPATAAPVTIHKRLNHIACSPAFEVPAGQVVITEATHPFTYMLGCSAVPAGAQGACNPAYNVMSSVVTVAQGSPGNPTTATVSNGPSQ